jgi:adenine-specific DNA-methyltransferase
VGTQAQFRKKKPPVTYRYDSSLSPALDWDGQNPARDLGEWLLAQVEEAAALPPPHVFPSAREFKNGAGQVVASVLGLADAVAAIKRITKPFLDWARKAERLSFDVPTLPLFVHERLSTKAIIETLKGHKRDKQTLFGFFADPQHSIADQVLRAYEHKDQWVNRMILGDSLVVMNSLLHYEGLGGQVQMIYMDPPYGVKFGSNFQPFVRKRDVTHGDDDDMTREPEMVQAYRDTWELGLHSYLTYMRDRLLLCRDLLAPSGSIFVQISDENLHHVRELMDEVFAPENFCGLIAFRTTGGQSTSLLSTSTDFLLWYAKDRDRAKSKFHNPTTPKRGGLEASGQYRWVEPGDASQDPRPMTKDELEGRTPLPEGCRVLAHDTLYSQGPPSDPEDTLFRWRGQMFKCPPNTHWKPGVKSGGMQRLADAKRLMLVGNTLRYKRYVDDFPVYLLDNVWDDTAISGFARKKEYVVETSAKVLERCALMATDPGDLILDPTCGSGTSAYVAEKWGRRWITIDVSRVPLALARQRLLTATFAYYELNDDARGPAGGFVYRRRQNQKGEEVGGIIPHIKLEHIANNEPPAEEVLVDRPEEDKKITRVCGPFVFEATIPTPVDWEGDGLEDSGVPPEAHATFVERMLEVLRKSPILRVAGNKMVALKNIRPPTKALTLSAEAMVDATAPGQAPTLTDAVQEAAEKDGRALPLSQKAVAFVFGPENGAVSEKLVYEAAREAHAKAYTHLYVLGFAIQPNARKLVEECEAAMGIAATYVQATPDLMMGDLLKNMRSSQIFSVCGLPEVKLTKTKDKEGTAQYQVELLGMDLFDPVEMKPEHRRGDDVPAWLLDTDYNGLCFHVSQAFFPRTAAWDSLKKALKATYEESVWDHLAGTVSAPFEAGEHGQVAVKVIDDRGNELLVVKNLKEAE